MVKCIKSIQILFHTTHSFPMAERLDQGPFHVPRINRTVSRGKREETFISFDRNQLLKGQQKCMFGCIWHTFIQTFGNKDCVCKPRQLSLYEQTAYLSCLLLMPPGRTRGNFIAYMAKANEDCESKVQRNGSDVSTGFLIFES